MFLGSAVKSVSSSTTAIIGAKYEVDFFTTSSAAFDATVTRDFKTYLSARAGMKNVNAQLVGRVVKVTFTATQSASLASITGTRVAAGSKNVDFTAYQWVQIDAPTRNAAQVANTWLNPFSTSFWTDPFRIGNNAKETVKKAPAAVASAAANALVGGGEVVGDTLAAAIKPIFGYAIAGALIYGLVQHNKKSGVRR